MNKIQRKKIEIKTNLVKKVEEKKSCERWIKHLDNEGYGDNDPLVLDFIRKKKELGKEIISLQKELIELDRYKTDNVEELVYIEKDNDLFFQILNLKNNYGEIE